MNIEQTLLLPAAAELRAAKKETAMLDARLLLSHALGVESEKLGDTPAPETPQIETFKKLLARRVAGEPLSRLVGKRSFWNDDFLLAPEVLDPRPETELLVELALEEKNQTARLLDLGTGTGCIALSLLGECHHWRGVGLDISPAAVRLARQNASRLGLTSRIHFMCADWRWGFSGAFDVITCNPPYIKAGEIENLAPEVRHDPALALDGGADGLSCYRELARLITPLLKPKGKFILELGSGQAEAVRALFRDDFSGTLHKDLSGTPRAFVLEKLA